jgi:hypothetical protein
VAEDAGSHGVAEGDGSRRTIEEAQTHAVAKVTIEKRPMKMVETVAVR